MAAGSIVIDLLLRSGSFETDTARAEKRIKAFEKSVVDAGTRIAVGFGAIAGAIGLAMAGIDRFAQSIGVYKDLAEKIGDTSASVAGLQLSADTSNTAIESVAAASVKLTSALSSTNEESDKVAKALKSINIPLEEFRSLSPVEQIKKVSSEFAKFSDGAGKTAVAVALFGKAGADLIPFLKDLSDETKTGTKLTNEQIAAADEFTKSMAASRNELSTLAKVMVADLLPSFQAFLDALKGGNSAATAFAVVGDVIATVFETLTVLVANVAFVFKAAGREIAAIAAQLNALAHLDIEGFTAISDAVKEDAERARKEVDAFSDKILNARTLAAQRAAALAITSSARGPLDANDARAQQSGINFRQNPDADKRAQSFLDSLKKQSEALGLSDEAIKRIQAGELGVADKAEPMIQKIALFKANLEASKIALKDIEDSQKRAADVIDFGASLGDRIKSIQNETAQVGLSTVAQQKLNVALDLTNQLKSRVADLDKQGGGETNTAAVNAAIAQTDAAIAKANTALDLQEIAKRTQASKVLDFGFGQELDDIKFATSLIGKTTEQVELLTVARQVDRRESQATFGLEGDALAEIQQAYERFRGQIVGATADQQALQKQMQPFIDTAKQFGDTISSAFEDAIIEGKNFSDVLKSLAKDLERILLRNFVTQPLGNAITDALRGIGSAGGGNTTRGTGGFIEGQSTGGTVKAASFSRNEPTWSPSKGSGDVHVMQNITIQGAPDLPADQKRQLKREMHDTALSAFKNARARDASYA